MSIVKALEKWAPIAGAVLLFGSWAVQQLLSAEWNASLARIGASEAVFHSYRAANGVFRAMQVLAPSPELRERIDKEQEMNYELGLKEVLQAVDPAIHDRNLKLFTETLPDGLTLERLSVNARNMVLYGALTATLVEQRSILARRKDTAQRAFLWLYVVGTLVVILGGIAKAIAAADKDPVLHKATSPA